MSDIKTGTLKLSGDISIPKSGGEAVWGSISGDIQNQTDLQNVLAEKIDKPSSATDGDFLRYRSGTWTAETVATWQGGSF